MLVLDTHVWVWWIGGPACPALSKVVQRQIEGATELGVSAISCVEVAWLHAKGRLAFDRDPLVWMEQALSRARVKPLPITPAIAMTAATLPWSHKDPADRIIVATALEHRAQLASKDDRIRSCKIIETVW